MAMAKGTVVLKWSLSLFLMKKLRLVSLMPFCVLVFIPFNAEGSVSFFVSYPDSEIRTIVGKKTQFLPPVAPAEYEIVLYEWDFDNDGIVDVTTDEIEPVYFVYSREGEYIARFRAYSFYGEKAEGGIKVIVAESEEKLVAYEKKDVTQLMERLSEIQKETDGIKDIYALIVSTAYWPSIDEMVEFYGILTNDFNANPENITYLVTSNEIPAGYEDIIDGIATRDNFTNALIDLGGRVDLDDLLIVNIECHGRGYIGYIPDKPDNVAYHGFCHVTPLINQTGNADEFDFRESEYELSLFCGYGLQGPYEPPYWDFHAGLGEWVVYWWPPPSTPKIWRWMYSSHYTDVYVEGFGLISDNDEDIDKFTDYTLGDFNKDGTIDTADGEVWDYDGDGNPPYDRYTGIFDEDDWGEIDEFRDNTQNFHSSLIGIPSRIFDHNLDNKVDIDVYPDDSGPLEVDGTDLDNNGCIDGIDIDDDGDMDDWVAVNETIYLKDGDITDDEVAAVFNIIECGTKIFVINTCFSGGFINDLSGPETIIMTGCLEIGRGAAGFFPGLLNEALSTYQGEADADGNGYVSIMEAFNHAGEHPHVLCSPGLDLFQYDDNGDKIPHIYFLPNRSDGAFGATVYLAQYVPDNLPPTITITFPEDGGIINSDTFTVEGNVIDDVSIITSVLISVDGGYSEEVDVID